MSYIERLLSEELVVVDGFENGESQWSETMEPNEEPDFWSADRIDITSWNGTYNRTLAPPVPSVVLARLNKTQRRRRVAEHPPMLSVAIAERGLLPPMEGNHVDGLFNE